MKVYQSARHPNTTITKITSKPNAEGKVKRKVIQKTKLPDGKKTKTKSVTKMPDGSKKTKKKTLIASGHKNSTKVNSVRIGKTGKTEKISIN